jgi:predicted metal-dependent phosphoesterase TrpH
VTTVQEAFVGLIAKGSPFHVTKQDLDVFTAIDLISAAGGVSVVAHVLARLRGPVLTDADITELLEQGLDGIEVDHIDHADADRAILRRFVEAYDVIATGSSDYHGDRKPNGLGCETTSPEMYARLVARASGAEPIHSPVR